MVGRGIFTGLATVLIDVLGLRLEAPGADDVKERGKKTKVEGGKEEKKITAVFISTEEGLHSAGRYFYTKSSGPKV